MHNLPLDISPPTWLTPAVHHVFFKRREELQISHHQDYELHTLHSGAFILL